ncbi:MAG: 3-isopropylmalate dehydratase large subunit [Elusimicrobiota bacterium]|jgi:3-isopropylmalate/(R)-2-methylmalate dehydratase large subunit|nr:3-isopropylmalate dehydratase large subunit [Elusimicrobiota bacterium]
MGQTITEKIFASASRKKDIKAGEFVEAKIDIALANDITAPLAIKGFKESGRPKVFDKNKIVLVMDHFTPNKDINAAQQVKISRDFAKEQKLKFYFEGANSGVEHALLPEQGIVTSGDMIVGADSHTCTYGALGAFATGVGSTDIACVMATGKLWFKVPQSIKFVLKGQLNKWVCGKDIILYIIGQIGVDGALYQAMEFCGPIAKKLPMADRLTICNMAIEAGGKSGIFAPDRITENYVSKTLRAPRFFESDKNAKYITEYEIDCSKILPQVSVPFLPSNAKPVEWIKKTFIDQVIIGSCTNGRIEDLRIAAKILNSRKVAKDVRLIIIPATTEVYKLALKEGLIKIFVEAGGLVSTPTCGPCLGGYMGILADGEKCVSTTNRNFVGRMGHVNSGVFLASPAVAAASAVKGFIASPVDL